MFRESDYNELDETGLLFDHGHNTLKGMMKHLIMIRDRLTYLRVVVYSLSIRLRVLRVNLDGSRMPAYSCHVLINMNALFVTAF